MFTCLFYLYILNRRGSDKLLKNVTGKFSMSLDCSWSVFVIWQSHRVQVLMPKAVWARSLHFPRTSWLRRWWCLWFSVVCVQPLCMSNENGEACLPPFNRFTFNTTADDLGRLREYEIKKRMGCWWRWKRQNYGFTNNAPERNRKERSGKVYNRYIGRQRGEHRQEDK